MTRRLNRCVGYVVIAILVLAGAMIGDGQHAMSGNYHAAGPAGQGAASFDPAATECGDCTAIPADTQICTITYSHICFDFTAANPTRELSDHTNLFLLTHDRRLPFAGHGVELPPPRSA